MLSALFLALAPLAAPAPQGGALQAVSVAFDSTPKWLVLDEARQRAIVSLTDEDKLAVISTVTYELLAEPFAGQRPQGMTLSNDGSQLFVALGLSGTVAVLDADSYAILRTIDATTLLGDSRTWDVSEARDGFLYVSANPGSNGFAWIVEVDLLHGDAQQRVASDRIIRAAPEFAESPDQASLYIGESIFFPNSVYKLDLLAPKAPIVLEDDHGSISGARNMAVSPDATRIVLQSGQVLSTASLNTIGSIGTGEPAYDPSEAGAKIWHLASDSSVESFDSVTLALDEHLSTSCPPGSPFLGGVPRFEVRPGGLGYLALKGDSLCGLAVVGPPFVQLTGLTPDRAEYDTPTTPVQISGAFFSLAPLVEVKLGEQVLAATLVDDSHLMIDVPAGAPGPVDLSITNTTGTTLLEGAFRRTPALAASDAVVAPGDALTLSLSQTPLETSLFFVGQPGPAMQCLPIGGLLMVDPMQSPSVLTELVWPFEDLDLGLTIPADPALSGASFRLQALVGDLVTLDAAFTNSVDVSVE